MDDPTTNPPPRSSAPVAPASAGDQRGARESVTYPLVTVALVAHNPGAWFEEVLESLAGQDYPNLDFVVIDAASDIACAPRVHSVIPEAVVLPLVVNQGFAKNANVILDHPGLGPYLLICHDDVALSSDCVRRLVEETLRSNAGVVGPKLLDWNEPSRILHVGLGADKTGLVFDLAESGEYDQEQHDAVRDVFAVPGAVTLVRADLFRILGGFDEAMAVRGEDLDLCWRAHALGARVLVNPAATARHREDLTTRIPGSDYDRYARRHRIRSMLSNYGFLHTVRVVPQALAASAVNATTALLQGRIAIVVEILRAWLWNLARLPSILQRRRHLRRIRQVDDGEVRAMQIPGFEGINAWRQARSDRREEAIANGTLSPVMLAERSREVQVSAAVWAVIILALLLGSRELISDGLPVFNEFVAFPKGPGSLLGEWGSTWRPTGVGSEAPSSLLHVILGFAGVAIFGQIGLLRLLVTVGLLAVGAIGAFRLLAPFRSVYGQLIALVVYVASPLPYNALFEGSWSGLVAYGSMPWIVKRMAMAAGVPPFVDDESSLMRRVGDTAVLSLILASAAMIEPFVALVPALLAVVWVVAGLATRRVTGMARAVVVAVTATAGAFVLSMPGSLGLLSDQATWSTVAGSEPTNGAGLGLGRLLRLSTGPHGDSLIGWVGLIVPALALVMASGPRLAWAARSWILALSSIGVVVVVERGWLDVSLPSAVVLLAPASLGLAFAAGMTGVAFANDLRNYRFGWRQLVPFVAVLALLLAGFGGLGGVFQGRWEVVDDGYGDVVAFFDEAAPAHARALWVGHDSVLPVPGHSYDDELAWALTPARTPTILDHVPGNASPVVRAIKNDFTDALSGAGNRMGRKLATYGIRYIVVVESNAPEPFGSIHRPVDPAITSRLAEQLDLVRVEVRSGATIYENRAYVPIVASFDSAGSGSMDPAVDPYELALRSASVNSLRLYRGPLVPGDLSFAVDADTNWELTVGNTLVNPAPRDWAMSFPVTVGGQASLSHSNDSTLWLASVVQLLVWIALVSAVVLGRRRRS